MSVFCGAVPEWTKGTGCNPVVERQFESDRHLKTHSIVNFETEISSIWQSTAFGAQGLKVRIFHFRPVIQGIAQSGRVPALDAGYERSNRSILKLLLISNKD